MHVLDEGCCVERLDVPGRCGGASVLWSLLHICKRQAEATVGFLQE